MNKYLVMQSHFMSKELKKISEKDKKILKRSTLVVADQIATIIPGLNIAWGLSKALYGAGLELRKEKAIEWVEMVRDNPEVFTKEILNDRNFQDEFVYTLEKYIRERNVNKREIMRNIFIGYGKNSDYENYEIERFYNIVGLLNSEDIEVLRDVNIDKDSFYQIYGNILNKNENIYNLLNYGLLLKDDASRFSLNAPYVKITEFGKKFIKFLSK